MVVVTTRFLVQNNAEIQKKMLKMSLKSVNLGFNIH